MPASRDRLLSAELHSDPHPLFAQLRREAPVWRVPGEDVFLVSSWQLVADAAARVEDFSNHFRYTLHTEPDGTLGALATGPLGPDVFAGADPPAHAEHRRIFFPELVRARIDALEPYVTALADELLDGLLAGGGGDAAAELAHVLPLRVAAERVLGFHDADLAQLGSWVLDGARLAGGMLTLDEMGPVAERVAPMASWTAGQVDRAVAVQGGGDVLAAAAAAVREGRLTRDEASFSLMVLVGAGAETTTSLIGLAVAALAERPALQHGLREEPAGIPAFVEEVLRYESPFRFHPRTACRTAALGGVEIPEGALVLLLWASANRDPAVFDEPDGLRPGRTNAHLHMAFGRGIHHCVGAPLARLEARVVLERLLARTRWFELDTSRPAEWAASVWIHRHERLAIVLEPV